MKITEKQKNLKKRCYLRSEILAISGLLEILYDYCMNNIQNKKAPWNVYTLLKIILEKQRNLEKEVDNFIKN